MPVDTKRISGPESSAPYRLYSVKNVKDYDQFKADVICENGSRKDERSSEDIRNIFARLGIVTQAKGSAYVEMGNTKVVVAVFEPREIHKQTEFSYKGELFCELKYAPFSCTKRMQLQPGPEEKELAASLRRALEPAVLRHLFENFQIDIFVYVLENDGSVLSTSINAAGIALADAEIPLYDIITAITVGIQGDHIFLDPTLAEEAFCQQSKPSDTNKDNDHGIIMMARLPTLEQVTEVWQHGAISLNKTLSMVELVTPSCFQLLQEIQNLYIHKVKGFLQEKKKDGKEKKKDSSEQNKKDL